jgi:hypothetical protein
MLLWLKKLLGVTPHEPGRSARLELERKRLDIRVAKAKRQRELAFGFEELLARRAAREQPEE